MEYRFSCLLVCVHIFQVPTVTVLYVSMLHCKQIAILIFRHKLEDFYPTYFKIFQTNDISVLSYSPQRHQSTYLKSNLFFFPFLNLLDSFSLYFIRDYNLFYLNRTRSTLLTLSSSYGEVNWAVFPVLNKNIPLHCAGLS